jgi:hypothetical protein
MTEQPYDSEDLLQALLAKYPSLLAGDQMGTAPRRWLLVGREASLPSEEDGAGRWSVDHLFLDQEAVPTLVEVKRGSDTRIRREVVGQMLDYAANAVVYWPVERLRATFEVNCESQGVDPEELVSPPSSVASLALIYVQRKQRPGRQRALLITLPSLVAVLRSGWQPLVPLLHPSAPAT